MYGCLIEKQNIILYKKENLVKLPMRQLSIRAKMTQNNKSPYGLQKQPSPFKFCFGNISHRFS